MKPQTTKKLFAFIIAIMIFSALPEIVNAQRCGWGFYGCRKNYICINGYCVKMHGGGNHKLMNNASANDPVPISIPSAGSADINFKLEQNQNISIKIYSPNRGLIKTLANKIMPAGEHQVIWNKTDHMGNAVNPGTYILQFEAGFYSATKKISVIK